METEQKKTFTASATGLDPALLSLVRGRYTYSSTGTTDRQDASRSGAMQHVHSMIQQYRITRTIAHRTTPPRKCFSPQQCSSATNADRQRLWQHLDHTTYHDILPRPAFSLCVLTLSYYHTLYTITPPCFRRKSARKCMTAYFESHHFRFVCYHYHTPLLLEKIGSEFIKGACCLACYIHHGTILLVLIAQIAHPK